VAIVVEDSTSAGSAGATSLTITAPTGIVAGELLVLFVSTFYGAGIPEADTVTNAADLGWTQIGDGASAGTADGVDARTLAFFKWATDDEPASYILLDFGTEDVTGAILRLSGVDLGNPIEAFGNTGSINNGNASMVAPDVTAVLTDDLLVCAFASNGTGGAAANHSTPGGMTEAEEVAADTSTLSVCHETLSASGATGTRTSTRSTTNQRAVSMSLLFRAGDTYSLKLVGTSGKLSTSTVTSLVVDAPASVADDDQLFAVIAIEASSTVASLSGWTAVDDYTFDNGSGSVISVTLLTKTAASEGATWTFGWTGSARASAAVAAIRGAATLQPVGTPAGLDDQMFAPTLATRPTGLYIGGFASAGVAASPMDGPLWIDNSGGEYMMFEGVAGTTATNVPTAGIMLGFGVSAPLAFWPLAGTSRVVVAAEWRADPAPRDQGLRGVLRSPVVYGPQVTLVGAIAPAIVAKLFTVTDLTTAVLTLDDSRGRRWQDELSEPGNGQMTLQNDDPDLASFVLDGSDLVTFFLQGWAALTMIVEKFVRTSVAPGEEADEATELSGRGHLALIERMLVYPSRGVGRLPVEEDRAFNWTSPSYIDSGWILATAIAAVGSGMWWSGLPPGFPAAGASWIWAAIGSEDWAPRGYCYFRKEFTVPADGRIKVFFSVDDSGTLYFDGQSMLSTSNIPGTDITDDSVGAEPTEIRDVTLAVTAGTHLIAVEGYNAADDPAVGMHHNPGGILVSVWTIDGTGNLVAQILSTDATWKIVEYPPWPPGMTPGQVMRLCVEEGQARGVVTGLALGFTDGADSGGVPWPEVSDIATKVGTDVLTFFRELSGTYVDMWMRPGQLVLDAWNLGFRGDPSGVTYEPPTDPLDPDSGNITALVHKGEL
jgi:hypothetical protein